MPKRPPKPEPAFTLRPGESITFVLPVVPRTKKNSPRQVSRRAKTTGKLITIPIPSEAYEKMEEQVVALVDQWQMRFPALPWPVPMHTLLLAQPLNCAAIFYRDADRGDAVGYYQGLADALEAAGVVADDKWIKQWDGSRLAKDANRPRIEVTLTAVSDDT